MKAVVAAAAAAAAVDDSRREWIHDTGRVHDSMVEEVDEVTKSKVDLEKV